jgi:hypothetical protein
MAFRGVLFAWFGNKHHRSKEYSRASVPDRRWALEPTPPAGLSARIRCPSRLEFWVPARAQRGGPTSLEFIGNTAYVVTLTGEIWNIDLDGSGHDDVDELWDD